MPEALSKYILRVSCISSLPNLKNTPGIYGNLVLLREEGNLNKKKDLNILLYAEFRTIISKEAYVPPYGNLRNFPIYYVQENSKLTFGNREEGNFCRNFGKSSYLETSIQYIIFS